MGLFIVDSSRRSGAESGQRVSRRSAARGDVSRSLSDEDQQESDRGKRDSAGCAYTIEERGEESCDGSSTGGTKGCAGESDGQALAEHEA
jgi:hypothetical protein